MGILDFALGLFWTHFLLVAGSYLVLSEQAVALRAGYGVMAIVGAFLAVNFWGEHLQIWTHRGRLNWLFKWRWARRLLGVATAKEYLHWVRTRSGRRPRVIFDDARRVGIPPAHSSTLGTDETRRAADFASRADSSEIKRLAGLAARTFWATSVDTLTAGLPADTAALLVDVLADAGRRLEADPEGAMADVRAAIAAARSSASASP